LVVNEAVEMNDRLIIEVVGITTAEHQEFLTNLTFEENEKLLKRLRVGNELLITDLNRV
jgi:hypothetical protein